MSSTDDAENSYIAVTPDNHVAFIVITALTGLLWSIFIIGIRLYLRLRLTPPFGYDDAVALVGTVSTYMLGIPGMGRLTICSFTPRWLE
jgi:hypothetical protein